MLKVAENTAPQKAELQELLELQRQAQLKNPYPAYALRIDRIDRLIDMVVENEKPLLEAMMADFENRSHFLSRASDILPILDNAKHVKKHLKAWMKPEKRKSNFPFGLLGARSKVEYLPMGVVGNISPWNFPVNLTLSPLADIFGAGNRAMLKPSELSPQTSDLMKDMARSSFNEDELSVVTGGPEVSAIFSSLKFDHLLFTGSTNIARLVSEAAAPNLIPLTLELGGKNPVVISSSADIRLAAEKIMWAKAMNGGQICLCPDTVFIPEGLVEEFVTACKSSLKKMYPNLSTDPEYAHIISQRHADRLTELLTEAKDSGARVISLSDEESSGRRVFPSLVVNADETSRIANEEVFGGIFSIQSYSNLQEAINYINDRPKPLALYYFGKDKQEIEKLTYETASGGMVVNDLLAHIQQADLPFGGVGDSGMGCYHGLDGFKNFSHAKAIYSQSSLDPFRILRPPYGQRIRTMMEKQIKR